MTQRTSHCLINLLNLIDTLKFMKLLQFIQANLDPMLEEEFVGKKVWAVQDYLLFLPHCQLCRFREIK